MIGSSWQNVFSHLFLSHKHRKVKHFDQTLRNESPEMCFSYLPLRAFVSVSYAHILHNITFTP